MEKKFNSIVYWYLEIVAVANIIGIISQLSQFLILQDGLCVYNIIVHGILVWLIYRVMFKADRQSVFIIFILGLLNAFIIGIMTNGDCFPQFFAAIVNIVLLSSLLCLKKDGVSGWKVLNKVVGKEKMKEEPPVPLATQDEVMVNKPEVETKSQAVTIDSDIKQDTGRTMKYIKKGKFLILIIIMGLAIVYLFKLNVMQSHVEINSMSGDKWEQNCETLAGEINVNEAKKLYDALRRKGYQASDIGNEKTFIVKMRDKANRKALYDYVLSRGDFRIGSYDDYEWRLTTTK